MKNNVLNDDYFNEDGFDFLDEDFKIKCYITKLQYENLALDTKTNKLDFWTFCENVAIINDLEKEQALIYLLINLSNNIDSVLLVPAMSELKAEILSKQFLSIESKCNEILFDFYTTISIEEENKIKENLKFILVILIDKKYRKKATAAYLSYHKKTLKMIDTHDGNKNVNNLLILFRDYNLQETDFVYIFWFNKQYFEAGITISVLMTLVPIDNYEPALDGEIKTELVKKYKPYLIGFDDTTPFQLFLESFLTHIGKQPTYIENTFTEEELDAVISLYFYACDEYYDEYIQGLDDGIIVEELVDAVSVANVLNTLVKDEINTRKNVELSDKNKYEGIIYEKDCEINELKEKLVQAEALNKNLNVEIKKINERFKVELYKKEKEICNLNYDEINNLNEQLSEANERISMLLNERMELNRLREFAYSVTDGSVNEAVEDKWEDVVGDKKILMFGGHIKMLQRFKEKHNNVDSVPILDISSFNEDIVKRYDLICINTNFMNHGAYYKLINACETYKVDFIYLGNENIEKIEKEIMKRFKE